jgi:hypothetical protein
MIEFLLYLAGAFIIGLLGIYFIPKLKRKLENEIDNWP